jgi:hypothetical protein
MTVSTSTSRADYNGNGVTTTWTVPFYFLDPTHIQVIRTQISTGSAITLALSADYTVAGAGVPAGGTLTALVAPTTDQRLSILRNVPLTQLSHYVPNDPFPAATHEQIVDQLTMEVQQVTEAAGRALTLAPNTTGVSTAMPIPAANQLIGWNPAANALQNVSAQMMATIVAYGTANGDMFSGTGAQTAFTLSANPGSLNNLDVSIGGVVQRPGIDYTWNGGTTLTFTTAPASGTNNVFARYAQALALGSASAADVQYMPAGAGAVATSVQKSLQSRVSVFDFLTSAQIADVQSYAASLDLSVAINACIVANPNATIVFPPGNYRVSAGITVASGTLLQGSGTRKSLSMCQIIGDLSLAAVVTLNGNSGAQSCGIKSIVIGRAAGVIPANSVGLLVVGSDGPVIEDVTVFRSDIAYKITGQLGIHLVRCQSSVITGTHLWLENAYELHAISCRFGQNGGGDVSCNEYVRIKGGGDTLQFTSCQFNLAGGTAGRGIYFDTYSSPNGIISFSQCHMEVVNNLVLQTATTSVGRLSFLGCTLGVSSTVFVVPPAFLDSLVMIGCPFISGSMTLDQCTNYRVVGNYFIGAITLNQGFGTFVGNTLGSTLLTSGACAGLTVTGNVLLNPVVWSNTATGVFSAVGNVVNDATNNALVKNNFSGSIVIEAVTAPTLLNSWANFGGGTSPAGFWKDPTGIVHLTGAVKSGTMGVSIFTLPAGYRPLSGQSYFPIVSNSTTGVCYVDPGGAVVPTAGSSVSVCLDGISFRTT